MNKKYEEFVGCLRHELMDRLGLSFPLLVFTYGKKCYPIQITAANALWI